MAIRIGTKVKTLVNTPYAVYDPYSKAGINHFNSKVPKGTVGIVKYIFPDGMLEVEFENSMFPPFYDLDQLEEVVNS